MSLIYDWIIFTIFSNLFYSYTFAVINLEKQEFKTIYLPGFLSVCLSLFLSFFVWKLHKFCWIYFFLFLNFVFRRHFNILFRGFTLDLVCPSKLAWRVMPTHMVTPGTVYTLNNLQPHFLSIFLKPKFVVSNEPELVHKICVKSHLVIL